MHIFFFFEDAKNSLSNMGHACLLFPLFLKTISKFHIPVFNQWAVYLEDITIGLFSRKFCPIENTINISFWTISGWFWYVVHFVYITLGLIKLYYRIYSLDNMGNIVPVTEKTWWTHLENPMALCFLVINSLFLDLEWTDDKNIR